MAYSMGGRFALVALALRPPEIERLVVIGSTAGIVDPAGRAERVEEDERRARRIEEIGVAAFVDEWLAMPMFSGHRFGPHDRRHRAQNTARGLASSLRQAGSGAQQPVWESLAAVTVPVLVLAGERDSKFTAPRAGAGGNDPERNVRGDRGRRSRGPRRAARGHSRR